MAWDWDKIKEDASGVLGAIGKYTPIGVAKGAIDMATGNKAEIAKVIRELLKRTPPGQAAEVVKLIIDRYKIDPAVAQRMVANEMTDLNEGFGPQGPQGTPDEGYRPIGIDAGAEDYYPEEETSFPDLSDPDIRRQIENLENKPIPLPGPIDTGERKNPDPGFSPLKPIELEGITKTMEERFPGASYLVDGKWVTRYMQGGRVGLRFGTPEEGIGSLDAGAPDITYEGSEGPKAPMKMAGPDRYQKILEEKIIKLEGELGRELTDEEYKAISEEAYEEFNNQAGGQPLPQDPTKPINPFQPKPKGIMMAAQGGRAGYNQGGRTGFQTGGVTESRVLPPEYIEALGKTYAADLTKQAGIPSITTAVQQQPGETAQQWQQRQAQAQQYGITKAGMADLAPQVAAQDAYQTAAYQQAVDPTTGLGAYQPFLTKAGTAADAATALTGTGVNTAAAGQPASAGSIESYMSPYQQQVIDATMADYDAQAAKSRLGLGAQAVGGGAFGSGRHGIAEAEFDALSNRGRASQLANLRSTGFQQAAQRRQQDLANQMGISNLQQGLGGQAQDFGRAQIAGLGTLGATQQAQNQAVLDAQRQFATMAVQEPVNRMNMLGTGVMGLMGGMSPYSTRIGEAPATAQSSPLATALGVGLTGADIYSRLFAGNKR